MALNNHTHNDRGANTKKKSENAPKQIFAW